MESIVDPSADALWEAVGPVVDKEGIHGVLSQDAGRLARCAPCGDPDHRGEQFADDARSRSGSSRTIRDAPGVELEPDQDIAALLNKN